MKGFGWIRIVLCVVLACVFVYAGWQLIAYYTQQQTAAEEYTDLQQVVAVTPAAPTGTAADHTSTKPTVPITVDFAKVRATAPDVVGWLYIPDTPIHYPVVQAPDNAYYLHRLPDGKENKTGSLFADYRNNGVEDANFLIYGHSMKNGTMFGMLEHYAKQSFYEDHPTGYLVTPEASYILHLFAGYTTTADGEAYTLAHTAESLANYVAQAKERSDFRSAVPYYPGDTVVTLSTCAYDFEDARYVVLAIPERVE